jgi:hypothetical protein
MMGGRMNFAPRMPTIVVGLVLVLIGLLGTFAGMLPELGGLSSQVLGTWSLVAAAVVLLLGIIFEGI